MSETCLHFNTSFTNICDRLNRLGVTADNVKTRQKEIKDLVDQTTKKFQDKIVGISESIEKSLSRGLYINTNFNFFCFCVLCLVKISISTY